MADRTDIDADKLLIKCGLGPVATPVPKTDGAPLAAEGPPTVLAAGDAAAHSAPTTQYRAHPIAKCWRPLDGAEFDALCSSLLAHGLLQPITLYEGQVLDGVNRYRGCLETGVAPRFEEYPGTDPLGFAMAQNNTRRHLDASQRAMVAARLAKLPQGVRSDRADLDAHRCASTVTQTEAAHRMHVSRRSVQHARTVQEHAIPEIQTAVDQGVIAVKTAAALASAPVEDQQAVAQKLSEGVTAPTAIRDVCGEQQPPSGEVGADAAIIKPVATTAEQLRLAYQALPTAEQGKFVRWLKRELSKADALKEKAADAVFREKVAAANAAPLSLVVVEAGRADKP